MKKSSLALRGELNSLHKILNVESAKFLTEESAANFITYILLLRSLSSSLTDFPRLKIFVPGGRTSNIHLVLIVGQVILQLRGYEDISSDDLFEYMNGLTRVSHSNFRRVLDGAVKLGVIEKNFSSFDKRVKQYKISNFGFENLVELFGRSLSSLQEEFDLTLISNENHELNEACMRIFSLSKAFHDALNKSEILSGQRKQELKR